MNLVHRSVRVATLSMLLTVGLATAGLATTVSVVVPLTGEQAEPEPVFTAAFGTAVLTLDTATSIVTVEVQLFGIDVADLFDIPVVGPFHIHIEAAGLQTGGIAVSFGGAASWVQHTNGITLSAVGTNVGAYSDQEIVAALTGGTTYLNLHTLDYPGGELRGDVIALTVPEPGTLGLLSIGCASLACAGWRRRRELG